VCGNLGRNLRRARLDREMTQEEVAERSGVHATEVSRIEGGKRDPQVSTVQRLAEAVGLSASDLLR
jgi:XRE family transcriptional regulator, fatty acid utilization regulator